MLTNVHTSWQLRGNRAGSGGTVTKEARTSMALSRSPWLRLSVLARRFGSSSHSHQAYANESAKQPLTWDCGPGSLYTTATPTEATWLTTTRSLCPLLLLARSFDTLFVRYISLTSRLRLRTASFCRCRCCQTDHIGKRYLSKV